MLFLVLVRKRSGFPTSDSLLDEVIGVFWGFAVTQVDCTRQTALEINGFTNIWLDCFCALNVRTLLNTEIEGAMVRDNV